MTNIIAIINQKGGVGKTATTCNLAYTFSQKNKRTLLIDLDPSANATHIYMQNTPTLSIKDFLLSKDILATSILPAFNGDFPINNLTLIPSHISLAMTDRELGNKPFKEAILNKKLKSEIIQNNFDCILIDCPPNLGTLTINAMYAADFILIPVTYEKDALEGVADLFGVLEEIKEGHNYELRILRNRHDARRKTANTFVAEKLHPFIDQNIVCSTIIHQDEEVNKATIQNQCVLTYAPKCTASQDYITLRTELEVLLNGGN